MSSSPQIVIDDATILILGGCGGPNAVSIAGVAYSDAHIAKCSKLVSLCHLVSSYKTISTFVLREYVFTLGIYITFVFSG